MSCSQTDFLEVSLSSETRSVVLLRWSASLSGVARDAQDFSPWLIATQDNAALAVLEFRETLPELGLSSGDLDFAEASEPLGRRLPSTARARFGEWHGATFVWDESMASLPAYFSGLRLKVPQRCGMSVRSASIDCGGARCPGKLTILGGTPDALLVADLSSGVRSLLRPGSDLDVLEALPPALQLVVAAETGAHETYALTNTGHLLRGPTLATLIDVDSATVAEVFPSDGQLLPDANEVWAWSGEGGFEPMGAFYRSGTRWEAVMSRGRGGGWEVLGAPVQLQPDAAPGRPLSLGPKKGLAFSKLFPDAFYVDLEARSAVRLGVPDGIGFGVLSVGGTAYDAKRNTAWVGGTGGHLLRFEPDRDPTKLRLDPVFSVGEYTETILPLGEALLVGAHNKVHLYYPELGMCPEPVTFLDSSTAVIKLRSVQDRVAIGTAGAGGRSVLWLEFDRHP